jgi:UDP-2,3-diacylglucosamine hydrolase
MLPGLPGHRALGKFPPVPGETLVVLSDAHLGYAPAAVETALLEFLDIIPSLGDALLINGDLFEFWFAYRTVVPRHAFRTAAALAALARKVPILMVGGNHDRWGLEFWDREAGIRYAPHRLEFEAGGRRGLAIHGDGLGSSRALTRVLERVVASRAASMVYRALHPELGFPLVHRLSAMLGEHGLHGPGVELAAARQRAWAERQLAAQSSVDLLVMGHTHRAAVVELGPGRHYLNPGAWFDGYRYALVRRNAVELRQFTPSEPPLPPHSTDPR